jgi:hypothetical protein
MTPRFAALATALVAALAPVAAHADDAPAPAADPQKLPFLRHDLASGLDARAAVTTDFSDAIAGLDVAMHYTAATGLGVYGSAVAGITSGQAGIGDMQFGGTYRYTSADRQGWASAQVGLVAPTISNSDSFTAAAAELYQQPNELQSSFTVWAARAGVSAGGHRGPLTGAVEVALAHPLAHSDYGEGLLATGAGAAGYAIGAMTVGVGVSGAVISDAHFVSVEAQIGYRAGQVQVVGGVGHTFTPRSNDDQVVNFDAGLRTSF